MIPLKINKPYIVLLPHQFMLLETRSNAVVPTLREWESYVGWRNSWRDGLDTFEYFKGN